MFDTLHIVEENVSLPNVFSSFLCDILLLKKEKFFGNIFSFCGGLVTSAATACLSQYGHCFHIGYIQHFFRFHLDHHDISEIFIRKILFHIFHFFYFLESSTKISTSCDF